LTFKDCSRLERRDQDGEGMKMANDHDKVDFSTDFASCKIEPFAFTVNQPSMLTQSLTQVITSISPFSSLEMQTTSSSLNLRPGV
jgi:hypothetical protein